MKKQRIPLPVWIERGLLATRFLIVIPIIFSVLLALIALYLATVDAIATFRHLEDLGFGASEPARLFHARLISTIIQALDTYLIAAVLLIVAFGLYELFIRQLESAGRTGCALRVLFVRNSHGR